MTNETADMNAPDPTANPSADKPNIGNDLMNGDILVSESQTPLDQQWTSLERQVHELIDLTSTLARENKALRAQQSNWSGERAKLIEKNELAKSRVESMITRLKALEHD